MKKLLLLTSILSLSLFAQDNSGIAVEETVIDIMSREIIGAIPFRNNEGEKELTYPDRTILPQNPLSQNISNYPQNEQKDIPGRFSPQTVGLSFTAATLSGSSYNTNAFPPDNMGAVGPTQYIIAVNGRLATYDKNTGSPDAVLNTSMDNFFASVITSGGFTSDPRIRYDRLSRRWFLIIIDVPPSTSVANRLLFAVSTDSIITSSSAFRFFFLKQDLIPPVGNTNGLLDYPTLGVDANALYIGGNMFTSAIGTWVGTSCFVINKNSILDTGPIQGYAFRNTASGTGAGIYTPQGVDNPDPNATEGYFIGVDNASFGLLVMRRVFNPGSATPTMSANINLTVNSTAFPVLVNHLGNTGGNNGRLSSLDDRLFAASLRNGHIWTAHNIGVNNTGTASSATRDGARWYDIQNVYPGGTPSLSQSGTVYTPSATNTTDQGNFWIPSINVNGQGHAVMGFSKAGSLERINAGTIGRLSSDALGTMQTAELYTASGTAYNPSGDPGGSSGRRWGDYSYTCVDPSDNMTMWTVEQFCNAANNYGCRVAKLLAPPPPILISASPSTVGQGSSISVTITGDVSLGRGFYDPGNGFTKRLAAVIDGGVIVNSITYDNPGSVTLNLNTTGAVTGLRTITITNPDGQFVSSSNILTVAVSTFQLSVNVTDSWNMVSVPGIHPTNMNVNTWWSGRNPLADVYKWTGTYAAVTTTSPREGYWMLHNGANTYNTGDEWPAGGIQIVAHDPIPVTTGWNMIGGYDGTPLVSALTTTPPGLIVPGTVYGWNGAYANATNLNPGYGYWVLINAPGGFINIPSSSAKGVLAKEDNKETWGKIILTDASGKSFTLYSVNGEVNLDSYQMPPLPPAGAFDVRYTSGRRAEDLSKASQTIEMTGIQYPVRVSVENTIIRIQDGTAKGLNTILKAGESVSISRSEINKLMVSSDIIPVEYSLDQNYPNPFNPSTLIRFTLPEDVNNVVLTIYDALGQKVAELINGSMKAGYHQYQWNASEITSGLYICELKTQKFVSTRKMMLLK